jgi:transcription initiation factor TFIID TATA-box-binding protein
MTAPHAKLVNAVGGGDLHSEVDQRTLSESIETPINRYDPEHHPSLYLKMDVDGATILLFRTGKYNIAGAASIDELLETNERFLHELDHLGVPTGKSDGSFEIRNLVYLSNLDVELELSQLALGLGIEHAEYEPEQFPGLHYTPPETDALLTIFRTGSVTLTGIRDEEIAKEVFCGLREKLSKLGIL